MRCRYRYKGPVLCFDHLLLTRWDGETIAKTEKEAINHLTYQFKKEKKMTTRSKISLIPDKLKKIETIMEYDD